MGNQSTEKKVYVGDGVYAEIEYGDLVLTTENGISTTNRIVLGRTEWEALQRWVASLTPKPSTRSGKHE